MWITKIPGRLTNASFRSLRMFSNSVRRMNKGLVLGVYQTKKDDNLKLTPSAANFDQQRGEKVMKAFKSANLKLKPGECRIFHGLDNEYSSIALVGLGEQNADYCPNEEKDLRRDNVRIAVAAGVKALRDTVKEISVDGCGDPEAAGEGARLCLHVFDELKNAEKRKPKVDVSLYQHDQTSDTVVKSFAEGCHLASGQNVARRLMEMPANYLTPALFVEEVQKLFGNSSQCTVIVRDRPWMEEKKMGAFLSVTNGSVEPPKFLEIHYQQQNADSQPFALVGKGVTFDSGGISIKPSASMDKMRADMGGAACVVGSLYTLSQLKASGHVRAFVPLCENMPSGTAMRPGDVVTAMNGKTIQVDNTDAEGRLLLADALCYASSFKPTGIIDMATLTGAMDVALGSGAAGVFTNSKHLWNQLHKFYLTATSSSNMKKSGPYNVQFIAIVWIRQASDYQTSSSGCPIAAGGRTGDRLWRMPLWSHYSKQVTESTLADVNNIGKYARSAGSCTAAAFLKEFCEHPHWAHIDIAGVMENKDEVPYLGKGMSGRPTRTIVEFLRNFCVEES